MESLARPDLPESFLLLILNHNIIINIIINPVVINFIILKSRKDINQHYRYHCDFIDNFHKFFSCS